MDPSDRFCPGCGRSLGDDEHVCPECGLSDGTEERDVDTVHISGSKIRLNWAFLFLAVYATISLIGGAFAVTSTDTMVDTVHTLTLTSSFTESMTDSDYAQLLRVEGFITLISGGLALIGAILCRKRILINVTLAVCVAASLVILSELIFYPEGDKLTLALECLFGLLVTRMVYLSRDQFTG